MELFFFLLGLVVLFVVYAYGKWKGHERVVTQTLLVQDTDYQAYRVELLGFQEMLLQSHVFYALSEPSVRVSRDNVYIDNHVYPLGDTARFSVWGIRITKLEE